MGTAQGPTGQLTGACELYLFLPSYKCDRGWRRAPVLLGTKLVLPSAGYFRAQRLGPLHYETGIAEAAHGEPKTVL